MKRRNAPNQGLTARKSTCDTLRGSRPPPASQPERRIAGDSPATQTRGNGPAAVAAKHPSGKADTTRCAFPSARQAGCAGLRPQFYQPHLRPLVDYDYLAKLSETERQWLAAFTEEHYRGYRLKKETQVTELDHLRAADRDRKRVTRGLDVMAFDLSDSIEEVRDRIATLERQRARANGPRDLHVPSVLEFAIVAGMADVQPHELRARNHVEDALLSALDKHRADVNEAAPFPPAPPPRR